jgi:hypothetical protein
MNEWMNEWMTCITPEWLLVGSCKAFLDKDYAIHLGSMTLCNLKCYELGAYGTKIGDFQTHPYHIPNHLRID